MIHVIISSENQMLFSYYGRLQPRRDFTEVEFDMNHKEVSAKDNAEDFPDFIDYDLFRGIYKVRPGQRRIKKVLSFFLVSR